MGLLETIQAPSDLRSLTGRPSSRSWRPRSAAS